MNEDRRKKDAITKDKYDLAIEYLTENPEEIHEAWSTPGDNAGRGGELFGFVAPRWDDNDAVAKEGDIIVGTCGCLQQIREAYIEKGKEGNKGTMCMSHWPRLWESIARDVRIPSDVNEITVEDLVVFAEWQREIDALRLKDFFADENNWSQ